MNLSLPMKIRYAHGLYFENLDDRALDGKRGKELTMNFRVVSIGIHFLLTFYGLQMAIFSLYR